MGNNKTDIRKKRAFSDHGMIPVTDDFIDDPALKEHEIYVEKWTDNTEIPTHRHHWVEFALVVKGTCLHNYRDVSVPLIPGDLYLIRPGDLHSYTVQRSVTIYNCKFYPDCFDTGMCRVIDDAYKSFSDSSFTSDNVKKRELMDAIVIKRQTKAGDIERSNSQDTDDSVNRQMNQDRQGILHLDSDHMLEAERLLDAMLCERDQESIRDIYSETVSTCNLYLLLVMFIRLQHLKLERLERYNSIRTYSVYQVLKDMEEHLEYQPDFRKYADMCHFSYGYFRTIFKDITGFSPNDYLNHIRIIKSLEYIQNDQLSIADAASRTGIYDANYFSRLFKKITGYPPSYFKNRS